MPPIQRLLSLGLSLGGLLGAIPSAAQQLSGRQGRYSVEIQVPVSAQRAWAVLSRYEAMAGVMPDIRQARVVRRSGRQLELAHTYQAPYTFGLPIQARLLLEESPPLQLRYRLLSGERIRSLEGRWSITTSGTGIRLQHQIQIDPELPAMLRPLYFELSEANLLQSMRVLRQLMLQR